MGGWEVAGWLGVGGGGFWLGGGGDGFWLGVCVVVVVVISTIPPSVCPFMVHAYDIAGQLPHCYQSISI